MKNTVVTLFLLCCCAHLAAQTPTEYYSETETNGILIQNSYPKGGPYPGTTTKHHKYSYLVFFSRVENKTKKQVALNLHFSADSIPIPNSPFVFMKLFTPNIPMTLEKRDLFSYGMTELESLEEPTAFKSTLAPGEACLFYVVAIFYETTAMAYNQDRGGNRGELVLEGEQLYYSLPPQVASLACGELVFNK